MFHGISQRIKVARNENVARNVHVKNYATSSAVCVAGAGRAPGAARQRDKAGSGQLRGRLSHFLEHFGELGQLRPPLEQAAASAHAQRPGIYHVVRVSLRLVAQVRAAAVSKIFSVVFPLEVPLVRVHVIK